MLSPDDERFITPGALCRLAIGLTVIATLVGAAILISKILHPLRS